MALRLALIGLFVAAATLAAMPVCAQNAAFARTGPTLIGAQPDQNDLTRLHTEGITTIVSARTEREMDDRSIVPFDEAAAAKALGMTYVNVPIGSATDPIAPELVDQFAASMEKANGRVLLHCGTGLRATNLWIAYLVRHRGLEPGEALRQGQAIDPRASYAIPELRDSGVSTPD